MRYLYRNYIETNQVMFTANQLADLCVSETSLVNELTVWASFQ